MESGYIAVIDSGVGGVYVLKELYKNFPQEHYIYFGDSKNSPYGNKSVRELFSITAKNIDYLKTFNLKAIVLGCNTLSVTLRKEIEEYACVPVLGVYPPVESAVMSNKRVLLLSTVRTAEAFKNTSNLDVVGLRGLAFDIENNIYGLDFVNLQKNLKDCVGCFCNEKRYYDTVILGCTHYELIKNKIYNHFCPQTLSSGTDFLIKKIRPLIKNNKLSVNHKQKQIIFVGDKKRWYSDLFCLGG